MGDLTDLTIIAAARLLGCRSRRVGTPGGRVHLLEAPGRGPLDDVVILHGFSSSGVHYLPLIMRLTRHVGRIVAPDLPAHGLSDAPSSLTAGAIREGLFAALDAVIDRPVVIIGNCIGGLAAVEYFHRRPSKVRGLVLLSPFGGHLTAHELVEMRRMFALATHREALALMTRCFRCRGALRHLCAVDLRLRFNRPTIRTLFSALDQVSLPSEMLQGLSVPTLVIWGRADGILPASGRSFFRSHLPDHVQFEEPLHFGHIPFLDHPDELARRVLQFLGEAVTKRASISRSSQSGSLSST